MRSESRLALGPSFGAAGGAGELAIHFDTSGSIAGLQFDLIYDPLDVTFTGAPVLGSESTDYSVDGNDVAVGRYRVVVVSLGTNPIGSGKLVSVPIKYEKTIPETSSAVSIGGVMVSSRYGLESAFAFSPFVSINGLTEGMEVTPGQALAIEAVAFGFESDLQRLEVLVNGQSVGVSTSAPFSASFTPIEPGAVIVTAIARGAAGEAIPAPEVELKVTGEPLTSFASWRDFFFTELQLADPDFSGATGDADDDGAKNIFEFLSGTNPHQNEVLGDSFEHSTIKDGGKEYLALTVRRRVTMSDTVLAAVTSSSLSFDDTAEAVAVSFNRVGDYEIITFRDTVPMDDTSRRFIRVELDYTPPIAP